MKVKTYIILEDIILWPLSDLVLINTNVNCLALGIQARAGREVRRELEGRFVSISIVSTKVEVLHDEESMKVICKER